jgi:REP element-mobilizing transposase RayT
MTIPQLLHAHKRPRLRGYDYSQPGFYFLTLVAHNRNCFFGEVANFDVQLALAGQLLEKELKQLPHRFDCVRLDTFVIMPNHTHFIIELIKTDSPVNIPRIVNWLKGRTTYFLHKETNEDQPLWQHGYSESIIKNEKALFAIRKYILENPIRWQLDELHPNN